MRLASLVGLLLPLAAGCSHSEFDLVEPRALAQRVGTKFSPVTYDPLRYHLRAVENRLVMRIENPTDDPIELLGASSYVIDPDGQSHPIPGQFISPHAYIRRVFPPVRPSYYASPRPHFYGYYGYWGYWHPYGPYGWGYDPYWDMPTRYTYVDPSDPMYFGWENEGEARLHLVFGRKDKRFDHDFVFRKVKVQG